MNLPARVVLVRGSGDVGSAVAHRLFLSGHPVVIHDVPLPAAPRRGMAFTDAIFDGACELEGVKAARVDDVGELAGALSERVCVPVAVTEFESVLAALRPGVLVDARMRKRAHPERQLALAPLTIGLGPNFVAGETTHLAIETRWGDELGAVITSGATQPLAGEPRSFDGHARDRFVYAPAGGVFRTGATIGQRVEQGELVASIGGEELSAPLAGILRGLTHDGVPVEAGAKVVEVDPRGEMKAVIGLGPRPQRIAEGVAEAIESSPEPLGPRERWNRRYAERGFEAFPDRPSEWLVENRDLLVGRSGRRALDVACGSGRNSRYLAELGFAVDAVDASDVAVAALRSAAAERGLTVEARRIDLESEPLPAGPYDVIVQLNYLQRDLFEALARALTPGGLLVIETVARAHVDELGNPFDPRFVLADNELLHAFPDLIVRHYREGVLTRAGKPRGVASLVAERPRA
jgi:xanthine dehydrogenase accessory factor